MNNNRLPPQYFLKETISPEITSTGGMVLYWFFFLSMPMVFMLIPLWFTEAQLQTQAVASKEIPNQFWLYIGLGSSIWAFWLFRRALRKTIMRMMGVKMFLAGRILSDVRFLGRKKYIPRVLDNYWARHFYFSKNQYMLTLIFPFLITSLLLLFLLNFIDRSDIEFLYLLFLFIFQGFSLTSPLYLFLVVFFQPHKSVIFETNEGLNIYSPQI